MDHAERVARGQRAADIINDPMVQEVLRAMELELIRAWEDSDPSQGMEREKLYHQRLAVKDFKHKFTLLMADGSQANKELQKTETE